jgi:type III secretion system YscQ/HrcQ family protein
MMVTPLALETLPKVSSHRVAALREAARRLTGTPGARRVEVRGLGVVDISFSGFDADAARAITGSEEAFHVRRVSGSESLAGILVIDGWLARALVDVHLGRRGAVPARRLGPAERGMLAAQLSAVLRALESDLAVSLSRMREPRREDLVSLVLRVQAAGVNGLARIEVPPAWLSGAAVAHSCQSRASLLELTTSVAIELASTTLPSAEWVAARAGDAVLFDGNRALAAHEPWAARLRVGDSCASAILTGHGTLDIEEPIRTTRRSNGNTVTRKETVMASSRDPSPLEPSALLASLPVTVVAELGRLTLRADELLGLQRGSVLTVGPRGTAVTLRVGEQVWARGELVDVDGELGVRITELTSASMAGPPPDAGG